jgi:Radial spokehead-like protein
MCCDNFDFQDEDDEEEGLGRPGPEKGPKPLSPISQDKAYPELASGFPTCWALRKASVVGPPAVVARSLTWPGSISVFAAGYAGSNLLKVVALIL